MRFLLLIPVYFFANVALYADDERIVNATTIVYVGLLILFFWIPGYRRRRDENRRKARIMQELRWEYEQRRALEREFNRRNR
ncbi:hypothetical protein A3SI_08821 [Nitritalea halalkaliphila LW7]|uniref:Uncharacterized protein n=1 Tax=Nitritalea halalkaliphila LW7 TaxID=1189621 RepID=I5C4P1_9BACT|nr:hypothetical protein A3SI_08821 [Nitritalea halalkaliphila LW7]